MSKYPDGKLHAGDEGELKVAMYIKKNRLIIDFGKDLSWLAFDKASLQSLITALSEEYAKL